MAKAATDGPRASELAAARAAWEAGVAAQYAYWFAVIHNHAGLEDCHAEFLRDIDPTKPLASFLAARAPQHPGPLRVLDAASGPVATCGWRLPDREVEVTAVDPLGLIYGEALDMAGLSPPVRTIQSDIERVDALYEWRRFHLIHLRDGLTQCYNPRRALKALIKVLEPGGVMVLHGRADDGEFCKYYALHQWNIRPDQNDLVIWRGEDSWSLRGLLKGKAKLSLSPRKGGYFATLTRRPEPASD